MSSVGCPPSLSALALWPSLCCITFIEGNVYTDRVSVCEARISISRTCGGKNKVSDPKETTKYDYITPRLKPFKACPESESKSLTHPVRT